MTTSPPSPARLPLSIAQREVLQDQRAWPGSPHLLVGGCGLLVGPTDAALLRAALADLIAEQPVLRLIPGLDDQRLLETLEPPLVELPAPPQLAPLDALQQLWQRWTQAPPPLGDAAQAPPWRIALLRFAPTADGQSLHGFLLWAHHSLLDGYATAQLAQRWAQLASARSGAGAAPAADGTVFLQHLEADRLYLAGPQLAQDAAFWAEELPSAPPPLFQLPPGTGLPPACVVTEWLPRSSYQRWAELARLEGQTEFAALAVALAWHYAALNQREAIVIGVPMLNRHGRAERAALGMFVGITPLHLRLRPQDTPRQLLAQIKRQLHRAMRHARFPASRLARQLNLAAQGRDRVFDLVLSFERQDYDVHFGGARLTESRQLFSARARFPLGITLCDFGPQRELALSAEGAQPLFDARSLALLLRRLGWLVEQMHAAPDTPLRQLALLPPAERQAVVDGLHRDVAQLPAPPSFIERFAEQAALHPQALALLGSGWQLRYGELAERARQLAARLQAQGLVSGQPVPLLLERGAALVVALLGVAWAGGAFMPIDTAQPPARLQALLAQALDGVASPLWLGEADHHALHPGRLDPEASPLAASGATALLAAPARPAEQQAAYVLFTSGSSGRPKAVRVPHGALARRLAWMAKVWDLTPADRSLQATLPWFDPALIELLLPLSVGASVALPAASRQAPQALAGLAAELGCSFTALVPGTLARLLDGIEALPPEQRQRLRLRVVCCGGELLPAPLAQRWLAATRCALWNVYGPTEACIFATAWQVRADDGGTGAAMPPAAAGAVPLGTPLDDTRLYVLDAALQPLPLGSPGDIWLGGPTLALDYLNEPQRSADSFHPDPWLPDLPGARIYRTGDRGLIDGDGRLQFLGRSDRQLKIRGQRVEPGEIEAQLLQLPGVIEAHVAARGEPAQLHAWLAPAQLDASALQAAARERLPELLRPSSWTLLDALPRTATGKLDAARLPEPGRAALLQAPRAPRTPLERELLALMQATLQQPMAGIDDDFFASGGDSLAGLDWLTRIEQHCGLRADLGQLAQAPTVARLAELLGRQQAPADTCLQPLPSEAPAHAPALFLAASGHGDRLRLQALAEALAPAVRLLMLQPPLPAEPGPAGDPQRLAARYGASILRLLPAGEAIHLAGFSVGGVAALETARWLQAQGVAVASLSLIDTVYPRWLLRQPWLWRLLGWLTRTLYVQELSMNGRRLGAMFKDAGLVAQVLALRGYSVAPYTAPVSLLRTSGLARWQRWLFGPWQQRLVLRVLEVEGLHGSVFEPGRVQGLAQCLRQATGLEALPPH